MTAEVNLIVKNEDGSKKTKAFEIEEMNFVQFEDVLKLVNEVFSEAQKSEGLIALIEGQAQTRPEVDPEGKTEEEVKAEIEALEAKNDEQFISNAVASFETLAVTMPNKAIQLLAVLADMDVDILRQQKLEKVLDVYDTVLEVNDIEKLVARVKKSLAATRTKVKFRNMARKATAGRKKQA